MARPISTRPKKKALCRPFTLGALDARVKERPAPLRHIPLIPFRFSIFPAELRSRVTRFVPLTSLKQLGSKLWLVPTTAVTASTPGPNGISLVTIRTSLPNPSDTAIAQPVHRGTLALNATSIIRPKCTPQFLLLQKGQHFRCRHLPKRDRGRLTLTGNLILRPMTRLNAQVGRLTFSPTLTHLSNDRFRTPQMRI